MKKRILVTSIGGNFSHDLIRALRMSKKIFILGTDIKYTPNSYFLDKFEKIPDPKIDREKYIKKLMYLCKKYKINFVFPCSENECVEISKNFKMLNKLKIKTSVSNFEIMKNLIDKHILFKILKKNKINVGEWFPLNNFNDLKKIVKKMGYPNKKLVLKPRRGSGSKGVIILDSKVKVFKYLLNDIKRFCGTGSLKAIRRELNINKKNLSNYFVMPYYNDKTFDVDCLAKNGLMKLCVPRMRTYQNALSPTNEGCKIMNNKKIEKYCKDIIKALNINGACDFDIILIKNKKPQIIDASCRLSGSSTASLSIGINFPLMLLKLLFKEKITMKKHKKIYQVFPQNRFELVKKI
jgi:biotin carboxylase